MARPKKTLFLASLGCVKNRVDSEVLLGVATRAGYRIVADPSLATTIVVNTCGFIGDAKTESLDTILEMAAHKKAGTCDRLVVTGCLSQRHPVELSRQLQEVDHFLGTSDVPGFERVLGGGAPRTAVGDPAGWLMSAADPRVRTTGTASAYVKIAEGCSRTCSFCIIPTLRGKQRSRPAGDIVREVEMLAADGVLEVNLVAQDTVAYGRDLGGRAAADLCSLIRRVADVPGIRWVRLLYLYPENLPPALLDLLGGHPRVVPYVDMPLQHVSDAMLRRMRRGHGGARIRALVERLRQKIPGLVFRTAFIVGHPGETRRDFAELCDFVRWARFDRLAAFQYSDEEGTASHALPGRVRAPTAKARYDELLSIQQQISRENNREMIGRTLDVLVEGPSDEHDNVLMGRHAGQAPEIDGQVYLSGGDAAPGTMVRVEITQASDYDLVGEIVAPRRHRLLRVLP
jgi:ribosomal protein S12 methylthiotransferase